MNSPNTLIQKLLIQATQLDKLGVHLIRIGVAIISSGLVR